jgi:16S rRNA (cytosine1402-N4)-methyltransferase
MPDQPDDSVPHVRRKRYRGTHPRHFDQKYKELDPQRFAADIEKVIERGQTPAGTHRPICVGEILELLAPQPGEIGLDATLGYGGHTRELVPRVLPGGRLFALDVDALELPRTTARLRKLGHADDVLCIHKMNFAGIAGLLPAAGGGFDFVLADLGVSSMQLDTPTRGFSYKNDGPLDLRLDPQRGHAAAALLAATGVEALARLLSLNADLEHADRIAQAIKQSPRPVATTRQLAEVVRAALAELPESKETKNALQRTFMALRIAVNDEFGVLDRFLDALPWCLKPGGRVAILSFHSGEDRRVAAAFDHAHAAGLYARIAPKAIRPSNEEQRSNPRSSCAKLRWAVRSELQSGFGM